MSVTLRLRQKVALRDATGVMQCLSSLVYDRPAVSDRADAVDAIVAAMHTFASDARLVGGCLSALAHVSDDIPVEAVVRTVRPHEKHAMVVAGAARLLSRVTAVRHLPFVAEAVTRWLRLHPLDSNVAYYAAHVLIHAAGNEPHDVKRVHGHVGCERMAVAIVSGCVATRCIEVHVHGSPWNEYLLTNLFPKLRVRA